MMVEAVLAWICVVVAVVTQEPLWAIAAALFAVAVQMDLTRNGVRRRDNG